MIKNLRLRRFRAFEDFSIAFRDGAILVGPNSAGKSTILTALRLADVLLRAAQSRGPNETRHDGDRHVPAWPLVLTEFPALRESVRHEFRGEEARMELTWTSGSRLTAVWPSEELPEEEPYFYLESRPGMYVRNVTRAREDFAALGVIPVLYPIDHDERLLTPAYVRLNVTGRLSSRHFRNNLRLMKQNGELADFLNFAEPWLDDFVIDSVADHLGEGDLRLDVFYREPGSRVPKELYWSGDGVQVWLQILFHVFRTRHSPTLILDEPEVYLHPDLQRRLVQLLETLGRQIIVASHSAELAAEASPELLTIVDKGKRHARRAKGERELEMLSATLGTAFNLRLAKALRSRVVLFVEGRDMTVFRKLAGALHLEHVAGERGLTVIRLEGYSRSDKVLPFRWLAGELLPDAVEIRVILDRDYRSVAMIDATEAEFAAVGVRCHVWRRKEMESYLLTPSVIARVSGAPKDDVESLLMEAVAGMKNAVFARILDERSREERSADRHDVNITERCLDEFNENWKDRAYRLSTVPPKEVISTLNGRLDSAGFRAVSVRSLATRHRADEIAGEVCSVLEDLENDVTA